MYVREISKGKIAFYFIAIFLLCLSGGCSTVDMQLGNLENSINKMEKFINTWEKKELLSKDEVQKGVNEAKELIKEIWDADKTVITAKKLTPEQRQREADLMENRLKVLEKRVKQWIERVEIEQTLKMAIKDTTNAIAYYLRAENRKVRKDWDGVIMDLDRALKLNPNYAPALHLRGFAKYNKNDDYSAISDFDSAIKLDTTNAEYYVDRGQIYIEQRNPKIALDDFNKSIKYYKGDNEEVIVWAYVQRGICYTKFEKWKEANEDFYKASRFPAAKKLSYDDPYYLIDKYSRRGEYYQYNGPYLPKEMLPK